MPPPALRFQNISKGYGASQILREIDLDIASGEFFGLVGMNGAGKTTLIKCLLDFCALDNGSIEIFGISHRLTEARQPLAFLPERFMPPYYLTGMDFLKYMLKLQALPYDQAKAETMLQMLDLKSSALTSPVRAYSKGMTQKLGLAACFLADKDFYVFDEPMSGLDPKARALLKSRLQNLHTAGRTLFFSSHALADVEEICDRMAILHEGKIRFVGSPADCCRKFQGNTLEQAYLKCIS
ncbi:MAG: ABC transporter ATP-binding protein [Deltaproteobacteria bacterium RIFOXYD12_FULL_55_16]|nr:MAG: ABC transporter ATP-binding protein [Deltaproteobacteria bacterium RIFOXYD12_FULL_55_16]